MAAAQARASQGDADAQFGLGLKCSSGNEEARDYPQAAQWYLKAADQSHALAQFNLGIMYTRGQGVPQDDAQALRWFRKAAQQGDAGAQFNLGLSLHRASVARLQPDPLESKIEAYKWFHLAANQGYQGSIAAFETLTLSLTREQVTDGNQRVAAFLVESAKHSRNQ
ncbi:MAG: tetratricopeptide repeat protein [Verrucomicrobia bacterium]|nr:tetratricopeptide repeat protein [Verrucomicrobiota bacterium]